MSITPHTMGLTNCYDQGTPIFNELAQQDPYFLIFHQLSGETSQFKLIWGG